MISSSPQVGSSQGVRGYPALAVTADVGCWTQPDHTNRRQCEVADVPPFALPPELLAALGLCPHLLHEREQIGEGVLVEVLLVREGLSHGGVPEVVERIRDGPGAARGRVDVPNRLIPTFLALYFVSATP